MLSGFFVISFSGHIQPRLTRPDPPTLQPNWPAGTISGALDFSKTRVTFARSKTHYADNFGYTNFKILFAPTISTLKG
jgi:hypothetical protein